MIEHLFERESGAAGELDLRAGARGQLGDLVLIVRPLKIITRDTSTSRTRVRSESGVLRKANALLEKLLDWLDGLQQANLTGNGLDALVDSKSLEGGTGSL